VQLAQVPDAAAGLVLERIREQLSASDVILWNAAGNAVASAGQSRFSLSPERPGTAQLRMVRQQRTLTQIEGLDDLTDTVATQNARVKVFALVASPRVGLLLEPRFLQVTMPLPPALVANALAVQEANREYQERALAREGLRRMYVGTLTLGLFLAVFGAVLLAVLLGNQLVRPLLVLAEGVREVAAGNLSPKAALQGKDELDGLTRSFATMTQQIADARGAVEQSMGRWTRARQAADHSGQPHRRRDGAGSAGPDPVLQPGRHAHFACAHGGLCGPATGGGAGSGRFCGRGAEAV
jgi:multi-sensor signal transduction histidine kinase (EC 2.7.13.3)